MDKLAMAADSKAKSQTSMRAASRVGGLVRGCRLDWPVILLGALGGMATAGILGMFVGATLLALGYQLFMSWVAARPDAKQPIDFVAQEPE
jgi:predicted PurR-regulated permease PerM